VHIFYYYAVASTTLTNDYVTFGLSSGAVSSVCQEFGISGADINAPFDPNMGIPNGSGGISTTNSVVYSTINPNDFLIILQGFCAYGAAGSGYPSGFNVIVGSGSANAQPSNCLSDSLQTNTFYKTVSTTQSFTVTWAFDKLPSSFAVIGDAIQSTPGPLTASVSTSPNYVDVGQLASFSCAGAGGLSPYTYSWKFGDESTGSGAMTSHTYRIAGTMPVVCTVTDTLGTTAKDSTQVTVVIDPSITTFTATPASLFPGDKVTFAVSASGGYGGLSYSYADLPAGCFSANSTYLSCYPTSSGNYRVTVTVTDRTMESANATAVITVGPQRVLGLPPATGLAVIFGAMIGTGALIVLSVALTLRRKKRRQAPTMA
jgi:hypothetical protein